MNVSVAGFTDTAPVSFDTIVTVTGFTGLKARLTAIAPEAPSVTITFVLSTVID